MLNSESFILDTLVPIVAMSDNVKGLSVMLGLGSLAGGVFSLLSHKNHLDQVIESAPAERKLAYESRKYRRRAAASSLIASQGIMLAGIGFVDEPRTIAILVSIILLMLVGVLGVAMFDFFSVGLNEVTRKDDSARKAMVDEYVRQRNRLLEQQDEADEVSTDEA